MNYHYVCEREGHTAGMLKSADSFQELLVSFQYGSRDQTQVIRLAQQTLSPTEPSQGPEDQEYEDNGNYLSRSYFQGMNK